MMHGKIKKLQCRGAECQGEIAPSDSSGERDFLGERLSLFARATFIASSVFFVAGFLIHAFWPPAQGPAPSLSRPELLFHLASIAVLLVMWMAARQPGPSERALGRLDAAGTVAAILLCVVMGGFMPLAWRPEMLVLLIANSILLYRAAIVPSPPRRTAVVSALCELPIPVLAWAAYRTGAPSETSRGASVAWAFLWAVLGIVLSTLVSFVTFRLRTSAVRNRRLGQYTLTEKLGEGGMGIVYRAEHEMLRRPTAIKLLPPGRAGEEGLKRFEREVQLTARLTNPHTVSIYDFGRTPDGMFYYVMEYLDGVDLETLVQESGPVAPGRAVRILRQICAALAEAHGIGLIHRDIKPANVLLCERGGLPDIAKVLDFGLVKDLTDGSSDLTNENVLRGTPQYMAPEAIRDAGSADPRSDLYAVGAVGYFLLTGTPVFSGKSPLETIHHHLQTEPEPLSRRLGRPVPPELEALILRCLSKDPEQRPETAAALARALGACQGVPTWDEGEARGWWLERTRRKNAAKTA
jgi:eukaryotic-like serine/threonine-protein kinase